MSGFQRVSLLNCLQDSQDNGTPRYVPPRRVPAPRLQRIPSAADPVSSAPEAHPAESDTGALITHAVPSRPRIKASGGSSTDIPTEAAPAAGMPTAQLSSRPPLGAARRHSGPLGVTRCHSVPLGVIRIRSASLGVTRCHSVSFGSARCHSVSLGCPRCSPAAGAASPPRSVRVFCSGGKGAVLMTVF